MNNKKQPPTTSATSFFDLVKDPFTFLAEISREYGDVVQIPIPGRAHTFLINHPDDIEQVLVKARKSYIKDKDTAKLREFLGNGLLTSEGEFWKRQRRLAQPAFHHQSIRSYAETMVRRTREEMAGWQDGETRDLHSDMMRLTLAIVGDTLMGTDVSAQAEDVGRSIETIMDHAMGIAGSGFRFPSCIPTPGNVKAKHAIEVLNTILVDIIAERRANGEMGHDLLSMLIGATDEDGSQMNDEQLRDELVTMFLAGHETTALALSYSWYLVSKHPLVARRMRQELDTVLGQRAGGFDDLASLPYTEAVVKESMRLLPPAWAIGREPTEDVQLGGYDIPAGAQLILSQSVVHRDPRWFPNPEAFMPERWLEGGTVPKFAYFPFGGGARICIGKSFAMMEATLILATMAQAFDFHLRPGYQLVRVPSITARPKHGMPMTLVARPTTTVPASSEANPSAAPGRAPQAAPTERLS